MVKLGLLFGGNSLEQEISIISAYQVRKKLKEKYDIVMLYLDENNNLYDTSKFSLKEFRNSDKKFRKTSFVSHGVKGTKIDCIVLCMHGENGEDGIGAAICRFYQIPFVGSDIFASSIAINKYLLYLFLSKNGIPMLDSTLFTYNDYLNGKIIKDFPCIIKPVKGGSSIGIYVCKEENDLRGSLIEALLISKELIIQKYYDNIVEYNLAIYENGFSELERITKKDEFFTFENKYNESFKQMHQQISDDLLKPEIQEIGRKVYNLLQCKGIIRIDFFVIDNVIYVNEVNTLPGALAMYLFADFLTVINECIARACLEKPVIYPKGSFLETNQLNK